jgi:hypothetical protein
MIRGAWEMSMLHAFCFRMILAVLGVLAPAHLAVAQMAKATPAAKAATVTSDLEFRLQTAGEISRLEIQIPDTASGRAPRRAISDLLLRVSLSGGDVVDALRLPNGAVIDRDAGLFAVRIYLVAGGRLLPDLEARCERWVRDVALCKVACDGGSFGLRRQPGQATTALSLMLGPQQPEALATDRGSLNLDACGEPGAEDRLLVAAGGKASAEIPLRRR